MLGVVLSLLVLSLVVRPAAADVPPAGWSELELDDGGYALLYRPPDLAVAGPGRAAGVPLVMFLHGAGGPPEPYRNTVATAARNAGAIALLPKSVTDQGWGLPGDAARLQLALAATTERLAVDPTRTALAGHSAGGAYAYLLAYSGGMPAAAVFTLGAPFYPVSSLATSPPPPIRMYYGTSDLNYTGGGHRLLTQQWDRLGVPWADDVQAGYGHGTWPQSSMNDGFAFLVRSAAAPGGCVPGPTVLCLREGRFQVEVEWEDFQGGSGPGRVVEGAGSGDGASGLFWFFHPDNWELMVKVLDGCGVNGHRWVFSAATTNVAYTLSVLDTGTGALWSHPNPAGRPAPAVTDTDAFPCL